MYLAEIQEVSSNRHPIAISRSIYSHHSPDPCEPTRYAGFRQVTLQRLPDSTIVADGGQSTRPPIPVCTLRESEQYFECLFC